MLGPFALDHPIFRMPPPKKKVVMVVRQLGKA